MGALLLYSTKQKHLSPEGKKDRTTMAAELKCTQFSEIYFLQHFKFELLFRVRMKF